MVGNNAGDQKLSETICAVDLQNSGSKFPRYLGYLSTKKKYIVKIDLPEYKGHDFHYISLFGKINLIVKIISDYEALPNLNIIVYFLRNTKIRNNEYCNNYSVPLNFIEYQNNLDNEKIWE